VLSSSWIWGGRISEPGGPGRPTLVDVAIIYTQIITTRVPEVESLLYVLYVELVLISASR
jgi:hypothetical protein